MNNKQPSLTHWIREDIQALTPYHIPDSSGFIKLDAMENPYGWPQKMKDDWIEEMKTSFVNRYPDPNANKLTQKIRDVFNIAADAEIILGNGSDEIIQIIMMALNKPNSCILTPQPGFSMFKMIAQFTQINCHEIPLESDFTLSLDTTLEKIAQHQPAAIFIAYPNNPTGNLFNRQDLEKIISEAPGLVIIDEAYSAFANDSFIKDINKYPNLVVMRTLSKMGLAGLRLGMLIGPKPWITELNKIRLPYNVNMLTQLTAEFALKHYPELKQQTDKICQSRTALYNELSKLKSITTHPTQANFILFRTKPNQAKSIFTQLKAANILIKCLDGSHPLLKDCLRVTIGTPTENENFLTALKAIT